LFDRTIEDYKSGKTNTINSFDIRQPQNVLIEVDRAIVCKDEEVTKTIG